MNRVLRCASEKPSRVESREFLLSVVKSTYQNANPPARFGRYRAKTFSVDAQEYGAQRSEGAFFRKITWC